MTKHDPQSLIKMAEQICRNIPDRAHVDRATSEHIKTFWAPAMIATLQEYAHLHPHEVSAEVRGALHQLKGAT